VLVAVLHHIGRSTHRTTVIQKFLLANLISSPEISLYAELPDDVQFEEPKSTFS
jgi:hypothetical protein